jgi:hypothetical protein
MVETQSYGNDCYLDNGKGRIDLGGSLYLEFEDLD